MRRALKYSMLMATLLPPGVLAHGGGQDFMGVVKAIDANGLTMETREKEEVRVVFDEKTRFEKAGAPSSAKELIAGDRVVVHTARKEGATVPTATLVKWGAKRKRTEHDEHGHPTTRRGGVLLVE